MQQTIFTGQTPVEGNKLDAGSPNYTLGTGFTSDIDGNSVGARWFFPLNVPGGPVIAVLYQYVGEGAGTELARATFVNPVGAAWNTVLWNAPVPLVAGQRYKVAVHTPAAYVFTTNFFTAPLTNGHLTAYAEVPGTQANGTFATNAVAQPAYPTSSSNNAVNYFADVIVEYGGAQTVEPAGIGSAEAFGTPRLTSVVAPYGIATAEAWGTPTLTETNAPTAHIAPYGIQSGEAFGTPALSGTGTACAAWPLEPTMLPAGWSAGALTAEQTSARDAAQDILNRLSGGKFGVCQLTIRPIWRSWAFTQYGIMGASSSPWGPVLFDGRVYATMGCGCGGPGCGHPWPGTQIELPAPVQGVDQVLINGQIVPPTAYRVDDKKYLVRTDGALWPYWNDLNRAVGEADTFAVTLHRGIPVPAGGRGAVTALAVEIAKARAGDKACRLPARVTQIVREGVTYTMLDNLAFLDKGRVGMPEVDMWLAAVNPNSARSRMAAWSPDVPGYRRRTS